MRREEKQPVPVPNHQAALKTSAQLPPQGFVYWGLSLGKMSKMSEFKITDWFHNQMHSGLLIVTSLA